MSWHYSYPHASSSLSRFLQRNTTEIIRCPDNKWTFEFIITDMVWAAAMTKTNNMMSHHNNPSHHNTVFFVRNHLDTDRRH